MAVAYRRLALSAIIGLSTAWPMMAPQACDQPEFVAEPPGRAEDLHLQAAFVFQFIQYVDWPNAGTERPCRILFTDERDLAVFASVLKSSTVSGQQVELSMFSPTLPTGRAILYIHPGMRADANRYVEACQGRPVLTISDTPGFLQMGGMINFYRAGDRLRFEANIDAINAVALRVSSHLLKLARVIRSS